MLEPDYRRPATTGPCLLILVYIAGSCFSLVLVASRYGSFHFYYEPDLFERAAVGVLLACAITPLFALTKFSFGWGAGLYLYVTAVGFVWLSYFSPLKYDHELARISVTTSMGALLLPALLLTSGPAAKWSLSSKRHGQFLLGILFLAAATIVICSTYGFQVVGLQELYAKRDALAYPTLLNYLININVTALLPYAFAVYLQKKNYSLVAVTATLGLLFYPVTFSKLVLAAPVWMVFLAILSQWFSARTSTILSLLVPLTVGGVSFFFEQGYSTFGIINFRMLAIPSSAIDHYSEFFTNHPITSFCQISFLKNALDCPYSDQLSVVMQNTYSLGNMNASLLATEGIASVGLTYAPIPALICGLVIAIGNICSGHLPERFILISGSILTQAILNVAFTTTLLTHGALILFLLWYITPKDRAPKTPLG